MALQMPSISCSSKKHNFVINVPHLQKVGISIPKHFTTLHSSIKKIAMQSLRKSSVSLDNVDTSPLDVQKSVRKVTYEQKYFVENPTCDILEIENHQKMQIIKPHSQYDDITITKLRAILEAVDDRAEMHANIGEQRDNWNTLLLNSINTITVTGTTMAGLSLATPVFLLELSSSLLFCGATGMLMLLNKLQPSQLVEEQRNATRLFKQLREEIETRLALDHHCLDQTYVDCLMGRVLALDKAYPLPLIGVMLEKFPAQLTPTVWWPALNDKRATRLEDQDQEIDFNGWTDEIENEMREIVDVLKRKDKEDYIRLGNIALKLNKIFAVAGPTLTGVAAMGSAFAASSSSSLATGMAVMAGALATIVNSLEHAGQVGMVFEMYRNCAGFYQLLEESIKFTLEGEVERRENGELYEMKMALQLGRSLEELRELAMASSSSRKNAEPIQEFASKLF